MRTFYGGWEICPTPSGKLEARAKCPTLSGIFKQKKPQNPAGESPRILAPDSPAIQMNLYLNYTREHLMMSGEADPVGIILCSDKDNAVVRYATGGIRMRVFASKYLTILPDEETLRREILTTQRAIRARWKEN